MNKKFKNYKINKSSLWEAKAKKLSTIWKKIKTKTNFKYDFIFKVYYIFVKYGVYIFVCVIFIFYLKIWDITSLCAPSLKTFFKLKELDKAIEPKMTPDHFLCMYGTADVSLKNVRPLTTKVGHKIQLLIVLEEVRSKFLYELCIENNIQDEINNYILKNNTHKSNYAIKRMHTNICEEIEAYFVVDGVNYKLRLFAFYSQDLKEEMGNKSIFVHYNIKFPNQGVYEWKNVWYSKTLNNIELNKLFKQTCLRNKILSNKHNIILVGNDKDTEGRLIIMV